MVPVSTGLLHIWTTHRTLPIAHWQIDTEDANKVLTVEGNEQLARRDVVDIINLAGFAAYPVKKNLLNKLIGVLA